MNAHFWYTAKPIDCKKRESSKNTWSHDSLPARRREVSPAVQQTSWCVFHGLNYLHPSIINLISAFKDWHLFRNQLLYRHCTVPVLFWKAPWDGRTGANSWLGDERDQHGHHVGFPEKRTRGKRKKKEEKKREKVDRKVRLWCSVPPLLPPTLCGMLLMPQAKDWE